MVVAVTDNQNRITNQIDADRLATPTTEQSVGNRAAEVANCRAATTTPSQAGGELVIGTIKTAAGTSVEVKVGKDGKSWDVDKRLIGNGEGVMEYAGNFKGGASIKIAVHDGHVTALKHPVGMVKQCRQGCNTWRHQHLQPPGPLIPPTAEELAEADKDSAILCYTDGRMEDGRPYYAYVAVKPSKYLAFKALTAAGGGLTLADYGDVIAGDFEAKPPQSVVDEMREKYDFDERFTEKLVRTIRAEQDAFMEQQEKNRLDKIVGYAEKQQGSGESAVAEQANAKQPSITKVAIKPANGAANQPKKSTSTRMLGCIGRCGAESRPRAPSDAEGRRAGHRGEVGAFDTIQAKTAHRT